MAKTKFDLKTFLKAQGSSLISSIVDNAVAYIAKSLIHFDGRILGFVSAVGLSSGIGTTAGGITNFIIGRLWTFKDQNSASGNPKIQALKYLIVWVGNMILVAGGTDLCAHYISQTHPNLKPENVFITTKILISLIVGFTYNYGLQKYFVFKK